MRKLILVLFVASSFSLCGCGGQTAGKDPAPPKGGKAIPGKTDGGTATAPIVAP